MTMGSRGAETHTPAVGPRSARAHVGFQKDGLRGRCGVCAFPSKAIAAHTSISSLCSPYRPTGELTVSPDRAPIVDTSSTLGKRALGCVMDAGDYGRLAAQAKRRGMRPGALIRCIATALAQRPELIATVLGEDRL